MMFLEYTEREGGEWWPACVTFSKAEIVSQLEDVYQCRNYTTSGFQTDPGASYNHVHSVRFPDRSIWDSSLLRVRGNPWRTSPPWLPLCRELLPEPP
jgi:hypothetical protein